MNNKITHGKVCRNITLEETKTPVATKGEGTTMESTITLNFHTGAVHLEEIIDFQAAKNLLISLQKIFTV